MSRRRAILTDTERELLNSTNPEPQRHYQAMSRIRKKITEEMVQDVKIMRENNPELLEELQEVICKN